MARQHRKLIRGLSLLTVLLVVAGVVVGILGQQSTANAATLVTTAANATLAEKTAHVTISGSFSSNGQTANINGSGDVDFTNHEESLQFQTSVDGQQVSIQAVLTGGTIYEQIPDLSTLVPGKSWISLDLGSLAKAGSLNPALSSNTDPGDALQFLTQSGATVASIGSSTVDGTAVTGYNVTFDHAAIEHILSRPGVPAWLKQASSQTAAGFTEQVYIDGSGQLRRMTIAIGPSAGNAKGTGSMTIDFSAFGSPVNVSPPPPDQVVSFQQFLQQAAGSLGNS